MNHKCFFHLFDIAILQYICKTKRSVICGKKIYIHISYILGQYSFEIFLFFCIPKNQNLCIVFKKNQQYLPNFLRYLDTYSIFIKNPRFYLLIVERQDHCVINNILSHVQSSKVGEEMYNSHHSYCSIYHYSEIYLLLLLQVGS